MKFLDARYCGELSREAECASPSPEAQAEAALTAFTRNAFFVFVADRQVDDLDEVLTLADTDVVSFVRLVPLVGG
jgi:hypothetical protein